MSFTKEITTIANVSLPIGEQWSIRRCRLTSDTPGPRICITSGIHGDEMLGQLILYTLSRRIQEKCELLTGMVDLYPMLNPLGLDLNERMVPSHPRLDMNRAFPGTPDGTPLEHMCWAVLSDVMDADLILDIHAGISEKNELFEVRIHHPSFEEKIPRVLSLCPDVIWIYPDLPAFESSLTGSLALMGKDAFILKVDTRSFLPSTDCDRLVSGILSKMADLGIWQDPAAVIRKPAGLFPVFHSGRDIIRITCEHPGIYIPEPHLGEYVRPGQSLGQIVSALEGTVLETVTAPCHGLIFTQRACSAVYPGTLLARLGEEEEE